MDCSRRAVLPLVPCAGGLGKDGFFPPGSITLQLNGHFELDNEKLRKFRDDHTTQWRTEAFTDGEQVGISSISITRVSDRPEDEQHSRSHRMHLTMHTYHFFDHLATHLLRLAGSEVEKSILGAAAGGPRPCAPITGFPNPCSVGISLLCEDGAHLALTRRAIDPAAGGHWNAGKIYNCVGENFAPRDFAVALDGSLQSTPDVVAHRGLYEEMGLTLEDLAGCTINIHSFAWSSDILDHKFFGSAITPLSRPELQDRWRKAPDRSETVGNELIFYPIHSHRECTRLLNTINANSIDWAPEAVFSTIRSLLTLRRISAGDLTKAFGRR